MQLVLFPELLHSEPPVAIEDGRQHRLRVRPIHLAQASNFVMMHHRHHKGLKMYKFAISVVDEEARLRGVAILGRPVARGLDDGMTIEVLRVATDGCANACSALLGASRRIAKEMGYERIYTYTLSTEPGTSLKAAGWTIDATNVGGGSWLNLSRNDGRIRNDNTSGQTKTRWRGL